jgi:hypothetical protein
MGVHKPDCRNKQCIGCGPHSEVNLLKERIKELELAIEFVVQWLDNTLGASMSVPEVKKYLKETLEDT